MLEEVGIKQKKYFSCYPFCGGIEVLNINWEERVLDM